jgi:hypothetical protein
MLSLYFEWKRPFFEDMILVIFMTGTVVGSVTKKFGYNRVLALRNIELNKLSTVLYNWGFYIKVTFEE